MTDSTDPKPERFLQGQCFLNKLADVSIGNVNLDGTVNKQQCFDPAVALMWL